MNKNELDIILKEGEGYKIEFKENISGIDKEIVAFANSSGGKIFIGVTDNGQCKGIVSSNKLKSQIQDIANNCNPKPEISIEKIENIIIVTVKEGEDKPYQCSSGFYMRIGANSQKMNRDKIKEFFRSEGKVRFDEIISKDFNYDKDFDNEKFSKYLELASIDSYQKRDIVLSSLCVLEKKNKKCFFNNAGILFFAKEPQKFIPWSVYTVVLYKDENGTDIIDRKDITGSLVEIVDKVMDFVRLNTKVAYKFTGMPQRENIYEYPLEAIREAVINSVMHKDYFEHGHNNILKIFYNNKIEIENIWSKPKNFKLGKTIFRRNQIIADLFARIHYGEKLGSGISRIKEYCKKENAPLPQITYTDTHFYIVFKPSNEYIRLSMTVNHDSLKTMEETVEKTTPKTREKTRGKTRGKIIRLISKNPYITTEELSEKTGLTIKGIEWNIKKLKNENLLKRIGSKKGGYWQIINNNLENNE